jgi:plasmid stabilization system protein ParE
VKVHDTTRYRIEVVAALDHYRAFQPALGLRFLTALEEAHSRAVSHPLAFRERKEGVRLVLLRRFPYALRFTVSEDRRRLRVLSLTHTARKPE